jgi:hypothetical protein
MEVEVHVRLCERVRGVVLEPEAKDDVTNCIDRTVQASKRDESEKPTSRDWSVEAIYDPHRPDHRLVILEQKAVLIEAANHNIVVVTKIKRRNRLVWVRVVLPGSSAIDTAMTGYAVFQIVEPGHERAVIAHKCGDLLLKFIDLLFARHAVAYAPA